MQTLDQNIVFKNITCWEAAGDWQLLRGSSLRIRMNAVRKAVLERCRLCGELATDLEEPFQPLHSVFDAVQMINSKLKRILNKFIAVDEGKIRKLTLAASDGGEKTWDDVPLKMFEDVFDSGTLPVKDGRIALSVQWEGEGIGPDGKHFILSPAPYTMEELMEKYRIFLPDCDRLNPVRDWLFQIRNLLDDLQYPIQKLELRFRNEWISGVRREFTLFSCPTKNKWILEMEDGEQITSDSAITESSAWIMAEDWEHSNATGVSEVRRVEKQYSGTGADRMFGAGVPYRELNVACSIWERQDRNLSQRITAGNAETVPVSVRYETRYDAVDDLPLWDTGERWSVRFENTVSANSVWNCASGGGLTRPVSGSVARTDLYRRSTVSAEYTVDHCGLQFVSPEPGEQ